MLNSGEIQTFLDLIKGLNESLRTLATKVELMERDSSSTAKSYNDLQKEMALVAQRTEQFRDFMNEIGDFTSVHASEIEKLNGKITGVEQSMASLHSTSKHLDDHLDTNESNSATIKEQISKACEAVSNVVEPIGEIREAVKPLSELVVTVKRPIAVVVIIYILVSSLIGMGQMAGTLAEWFGSKTGSSQQETPQRAVLQPQRQLPPSGVQSQSATQPNIP
jgi:uncharacterized phage infection (PIP) family protein YhgE